MFRNLITAFVFTAAALTASTVATAQPATTGTDTTAPTAAAPVPAQPVVEPTAGTAPSTAAAPSAEAATAAAATAAAKTESGQAATTAPVAPPATEGAKPAPKAGVDAAAKAAAVPKGEVAEEEKYPFTDFTPDSYWMPAKATGGSTDHVDWMFYAILGLSIFCFFAIAVAVFYLVWRYRHRPGHHAEPSTAHDNVLEVVWTVIPSIICVFIFIGGWKGYLNMTTPPGDALEIQVTGSKWKWSFKNVLNVESSFPSSELHVPVNRPVKLQMRSEDVLHSFYLPSFRTKQDVIPGRYSYVWFEADTPGVYKVYCAEYCGEFHSNMKTKVVVHERGGYETWLQASWDATQKKCEDEFPGDPAAIKSCLEGKGEKLYKDRGCKQCHSIDGSSGTGPTFKGMWGETRKLTDGTTVTVDANYIRESVLDPMAKIRAGFNPVMPTFKGKLTDKDIDELTAWMKSL